MAIKEYESIAEIKIRQAYWKRGINKYKLKKNNLYEISLKDGTDGRNTTVKRKLICIKNYKNFILFKDIKGLNVCYLKIDLIRNPNKVKAL